MSAKVTLPTNCDFIVVRNRNGFPVFEKRSIEVRVTEAMHGVIKDIFDGKYLEPVDMSDFALGFIACLDTLGRGHMRVKEAEGKPSLREVIVEAFGDVNGKAPLKRTSVMSDACQKMVERTL